MIPDGTVQLVRTSLLLGVQLDDFDFRLFLRDYHRDLRSRFPEESFPAYSPSVVLNSLIPRYDASGDSRAGRRAEALQQYTQRAFRLDLTLTGSDYGSLEKRQNPYSLDRAFYHLGRELVCSDLRMDYPGYNPYRSTRRLPVSFVADHFDEVLELVPDYLWWAMHDQRDMILNATAPEQLEKVHRRIELAGFNTASFGLYLTSHERLILPEDG